MYSGVSDENVVRLMVVDEFNEENLASRVLIASDESPPITDRL